MRRCSTLDASPTRLPACAKRSPAHPQTAITASAGRARWKRPATLDGALHVLTDGIALSPASVAMRNAAILLCMRRRDFSQAVRLAEKARSLGIADACTFGMKGHALSSLGQHDEAAIAYQDALKLGPEDPYVRHLVVSSGAMPDSKRAPEDYIRTVFDGYADRFEAHLISLGYQHSRRHPHAAAGPSEDRCRCAAGSRARSWLRHRPGRAGDRGSAARTVHRGRPVAAHAGACSGQAAVRRIAGSRRIIDLTEHPVRWPLIVAADVLCYFGALEDLLAIVRQRLQPDGWFVFSVEAMLPDHDGVIPGNGDWALHRQGRYAHAEHYVYEAVCAAGFRVLRMDRPVVRQEAGADVPGLLFAVAPIGHDD